MPSWPSRASSSPPAAARSRARPAARRPPPPGPRRRQRPRPPRAAPASRSRSPKPGANGGQTEAEGQARPEQDLRRSTVQTNCGDFTIPLDLKNSPNTAAVVRGAGAEGLLRRHDLPPHRARLRDPGRRPDRQRHRRPRLLSTVDKPPRDAAYTAGVVAMAKTGNEPAGTAGSQFFVVTAPDARPAARLRAARQGHEGHGRGAGDRQARRPGEPTGTGTPAAGRGDREDEGPVSLRDRGLRRRRGGLRASGWWSARASCPWWWTSGPSGAGRARRSRPALERAAGAREGKVELAKVDVDQNQRWLRASASAASPP